MTRTRQLAPSCWTCHYFPNIFKQEACGSRSVQMVVLCSEYSTLCAGLIRPPTEQHWPIGAKLLSRPHVHPTLAYHRLCGPLLERAEANRIESRTLANLRDTLLPQLLTGELSAKSTLNEDHVA